MFTQSLGQRNGNDNEDIMVCLLLLDEAKHVHYLDLDGCSMSHAKIWIPLYLGITGKNPETFYQGF